VTDDPALSEVSSSVFTPFKLQVDAIYSCEAFGIPESHAALATTLCVCGLSRRRFSLFLESLFRLRALPPETNLSLPDAPPMDFEVRHLSFEAIGMIIDSVLLSVPRTKIAIPGSCDRDARICAHDSNTFVFLASKARLDMSDRELIGSHSLDGLVSCEFTRRSFHCPETGHGRRSSSDVSRRVSFCTPRDAGAVACVSLSLIFFNGLRSMWSTRHCG
jgi:hypothetical protein